MSDAKPPPERKRKFLVCVDDTPECRLALRFASGRAHNTGFGVTLLRVTDRADFQHWMAVEERMSEEARTEAERLLQGLAKEVNDRASIMPELVVREGLWSDEILKLIDEDPDIWVLVLAAAVGSEGPGPLVRTLADQLAGSMHIPVTVVPGNLTIEQIDAMT